VYLKSITLKGFKSFPDRTRLEFGRGTSVIVGPNGSGKSNVTDAVLWALGEQSPVAVRGQSMQDVIFGGVPGRQAARAAEVELVLDDSEGRLGLGTSEVSIVRRLDRSGEGEYRLAGARCRLVDVIELLSDTGMGKEMHSVISQGRVEALVTSKPRERRLLIEEAAGLGKHRKRRRRAQRKLERTQENLDRALDVEREARSRLKPLKRQAEAAERHARIERQRLEARWELAREDLRARGQELDAAQAQAASARERRLALERELQEVAARRQRAEEALAARSARREELSRRCFAARSAQERIGYRAEAVAAGAETLGRRLQRDDERLRALAAQPIGEQQDEQAPARIAALESELERLESDREAELARQLAELEAQRERLAAELRRHDAALDAAAQKRRRAEADAERARGDLRERERAVEAARRAAATAGGELAAVNQFLRGHHRAPAGARSLAEALEVDPGLELAVAAALDGRLGAALVEDRAQAGEVLDAAGAEGGRALVCENISESGWASTAPTPPVPGAEPLAEHVHGSGPALALARRLLADVWVLDSLESLPAGFSAVAVTRSGRVWSGRSGELRQPAAVGEERVLAERNRREQLIAASEAAVRAEHAARAQLERVRAEAARSETEREQAVAAHRRAVRERDELLEEERRNTAAIARRRQAPDEGPDAGRRAQLRADLAGERAALERASREREERRRAVQRLEQSLARARRLMPELERVRAAIELARVGVGLQLQRFEAELSADRQAGEHVAAELRECAGLEADLQGRLHDAAEQLTGLEVRLSRARDQRAEAERVLCELAQTLGLQASAATDPLGAQERASLQARLERLTRRREQLGPVNPLAQEEYAQALAHVEELESQRLDLETALRELGELISETDREIRERFERTFQAAASNFEELVGRLFPGGRGRLRLVCERDGAPRVLGDQPLEPEEDGAGEPGEQRPGEEDALGVEIEITPAGKAMKRLSLLSGGEKSMTALAFLFAVFLARPCPFYILDEVEAALDDINIDRFLALLDSYSQRAQFIVVTHQKRTMEAADTLYGVSMGGEGISKVISQRMPPRAPSAESTQAAAA
jgi:chromosome segregation protein